MSETGKEREEVSGAGREGEGMSGAGRDKEGCERSRKGERGVSGAGREREGSVEQEGRERGEWSRKGERGGEQSRKEAEWDTTISLHFVPQVPSSDSNCRWAEGAGLGWCSGRGQMVQVGLRSESCERCQ